jgi:tetratricopeptide (TPR) repeat protein
MSACAGRVLLAAAACLALLTGCETSTKLGDLLHPKSDDTLASSVPETAMASEPPAISEPTTTGSAAPVPDPVIAAANAGLLGSDPYDDLNLGKKQYRAGNFGLAERYFRRAVELHPRDAEAWVGLAASYDRLRRFDLADRAYEQALAIIGPSPELLNNRGYSYMLRGDYGHARETLLAARAKDPSNPYVQNNLDLLEKSFRNGKAVR